MSPAPAGKICVVCGTDCSNKPRTKDPKGRYFCQECYAKVKSKPVATPSVPPNSRTKPTPKPATKPEPEVALDGDDGLMNILDELIAEAPPSQIAVSAGCPGCGKALETGAIVCTNCGYNLQQQAASKTKVKKAPRIPTGGVIWPPLVGIFSMLIGGVGVLGYGAVFLMAILGAMQPGAFVPSLFSTLPVGCLLTSLSAWLLRDGYRILHRNSDGVKWIRFWGMAKLMVFGTCLSLFMAIPAHKMDQALTQAQRGDIHVTAADIKASILLVMLWFMLWPIFVLVFFFIPRIVADVDEWD